MRSSPWYGATRHLGPAGLLSLLLLASPVAAVHWYLEYGRWVTCSRARPSICLTCDGNRGLPNVVTCQRYCAAFCGRTVCPQASEWRQPAQNPPYDLGTNSALVMQGGVHCRMGTQVSVERHPGVRCRSRQPAIAQCQHRRDGGPAGDRRPGQNQHVGGRCLWLARVGVNSTADAGRNAGAEE